MAKKKKTLQGEVVAPALVEGTPASEHKTKKLKKKQRNSLIGDSEAPAPAQGPQKVVDVIKKEKRKKKKGNVAKGQDAPAGGKSGSSMKAKTIMQPTKKLHELTNAPLVGVVAGPTLGMKTGAKNENIWQDPESQDSKGSGGLHKFLVEKQAGVKRPRVSPCVEGLRNRCAWKSREKLKTLLRMPPPLVSWERWQASCKLTEYLAAVRGRKEEHDLDPLLPDNPNIVETGLVTDLQRCPGNHDVKGIARGMTAHSASMAKAVRARAAKCTEEGGPSSCSECHVEVAGFKHTYDVYLKLDKKRLLKLNTQHYKKLRKIYGEGTDKLFHRDLYLMLARYNALSGHGMQAALPEQVFGVLHKALGCHFECFASPLNARYAKFCSAFYDVDHRFGSIGDFFNATAVKPGDGACSGALREWMLESGGSYELNPPFIESVMRQTANRIEEILEQSAKTAGSAGAPLSFCVFFPGWKDSEAFQKLQKSRFLSKAILVAAKEHGYVSGAQHQRKDRYLDSPFDTVVLVLQNPRGKATWSTEGSFEPDLRKAFAMAIPTDAMRERRLKEGRGYSDFDGGGGVFKGKKKKDKEEAKAAEGAGDAKPEGKAGEGQSYKERSWWKKKKKEGGGGSETGGKKQKRQDGGGGQGQKRNAEGGQNRGKDKRQR